MDKEFDYYMEVEYVCEKGWDYVGFFVSYIGFDNVLLMFSMVNGVDNGD